jgi:hypothetical protein
MPVYSMTGYASAQHSTANSNPDSEHKNQPAGQLGLEIRSVNSRFLDLGFRLPDELRSMEPVLRQMLTGGLKRGKVELRDDGFLAIDDDTGNYLAGAALPMTAAIPVLVNQVGLSLGETVALMTSAPGRFVGGRGVLAIGQPADLMSFHWDGSSARPEVAGVWLRGESIR